MEPQGTLSTFLIPYITPLPVGYNCTVFIPLNRVGIRLVGGGGRVNWQLRVYHSGKVVHERSHRLEFKEGKLVHEAPSHYVWESEGFDWGGNAGFIENNFTVGDDNTFFTTKLPVSFYALFSAPNRKTFRTDGDFKFSSPLIINQIVAFGKFADGYPVVRLDRERDYGESLSMINPFKRLIVANIFSHDRREMRRVRISPISARNVSLAPLMRDDEMRWSGRIQITANNRLLIYHIRHSLREPTAITDHEHLDAFRGEATHLPAFQILRMTMGKIIRDRYPGLIKRKMT